MHRQSNKPTKHIDLTVVCSVYLVKYDVEVFDKEGVSGNSGNTGSHLMSGFWIKC